MTRIITCLILAFSFFFKTYACLNGETKELKDGTFLYEDQEGDVPYGHNFSGDEHYKAILPRLDSLYHATNDLDYLSDKGLLLVLLKEYDKAIALYLDIEKIQPGRYATASNIGTAYELKGDNANALKWIKKAVAIDPRSHNSSEWIHVKILEAKIKGEQFYTSDFLLKTNFGSSSLPRSDMKEADLEKLADALYYQLNERVSFIEPKEKIVAQLFFDLGNAAFLLTDYSDAAADYEMAKMYGFSGPIIDERLKIANSSREKSRPKEVVPASIKKDLRPGYILWGAAAVVTLILALLLIKRKRSNNG